MIHIPLNAEPFDYVIFHGAGGQTPIPSLDPRMEFSPEVIQIYYAQ